MISRRAECIVLLQRALGPHLSEAVAAGEVSEEDCIAWAECRPIRNAVCFELLQGRGDEPDGAAATAAIVQFWDRSELPEDVANTMATWRDADGVADIARFDDRSAERFVAENFSAPHVEAYRRGHHPAMRSDYFRLCYAMVHGGVYVDADEGYSGAGLPALLAQCSGLSLKPLVWATDDLRLVAPGEWSGQGRATPAWNYYFANSPLICSPGHPAVAYALERATARLLEAAPGQQLDLHDTAGPAAITAAVVWMILQVAAARLPPHPISVIDWNSIASTHHHLRYKKDARDWRQGETLPFAP